MEVVINRQVSEAIELAVEAAYERGRASRDAEVAMLRTRIEELTTQRDELIAEKVAQRKARDESFDRALNEELPF